MSDLCAAPLQAFLDGLCETVILFDVADRIQDTSIAIAGAFEETLTSLAHRCPAPTPDDVCTWTVSSIEAVAESEALLLAQAFLDLSTCACGVDATDIARPVAEIVVSTITSLQADNCAAGVL